MNFLDKNAPIDIYHGNLPHWRQSSVAYYVTSRTADSLPQVKLKAWIRERDEWLVLNPEPRSEQQTKEYHQLFTNRLERWLDQGYGECLLAQDIIKEIMIKTLFFFHGQRYRIWDYTVAANHVHCIIEPLADNILSKIIHSIKSYSAQEINSAQGRTGNFWQKEYFDHIVRSEAQFDKFVRYIRNHDNASRRDILSH